MPPGQRRRRLGLARHPHLLQQRHPGRPDRHAQGNQRVSNIDYFGEPIYTYSLKQGIEDGYLAPYKVIRVDLDKDTFGWRPPRA
jgi:predicted helicase